MVTEAGIPVMALPSSSSAMRAELAKRRRRWARGALRATRAPVACVPFVCRRVRPSPRKCRICTMTSLLIYGICVCLCACARVCLRLCAHHSSPSPFDVSPCCRPLLTFLTIPTGISTKPTPSSYEESSGSALLYPTVINIQRSLTKLRITTCPALSLPASAATWQQALLPQRSHPRAMPASIT